MKRNNRGNTIDLDLHSFWYSLNNTILERLENYLLLAQQLTSTFWFWKKNSTKYWIKLVPNENILNYLQIKEIEKLQYDTRWKHSFDY